VVSLFFSSNSREDSTASLRPFPVLHVLPTMCNSLQRSSGFPVPLLGASLRPPIFLDACFFYCKELFPPLPCRAFSLRPRSSSPAVSPRGSLAGGNLRNSFLGKGRELFFLLAPLAAACILRRRGGENAFFLSTRRAAPTVKSFSSSLV